MPMFRFHPAVKLPRNGLRFTRWGNDVSKEDKESIATPPRSLVPMLSQTGSSNPLASGGKLCRLLSAAEKPLDKLPGQGKTTAKSATAQLYPIAFRVPLGYSERRAE
jgi:hypothetical protein